MLMTRIEPEIGWGGLVAVRLLRRWVVARSAGEAPLPSLVALAAELRLSATVAVALGSLFELTEGCLGRLLRSERCGSARIAPDERAILILLATAAPARPAPWAPREIPHGIPGALAWAVQSARALLRDEQLVTPPFPSGRCPFERA